MRRRVVVFGLKTVKMTVLAAIAMVLFGFMFQARLVIMELVTPEDVESPEDHRLSVCLLYCKAKPTSHPLLLWFPCNSAWEVGYAPNEVLIQWKAIRPGGSGFFNLRSQDDLSAASLELSLEFVLSELDIIAPSGYYFWTHQISVST